MLLMMKRAKESDVEPVGDRLKRTRLAFKMNQATWCRMVGIETQAWNNYEAGRRRISVDQAIKVCAATGVTIDWIFRGMMSASIPAEIQIELQKQQKG